MPQGSIHLLTNHIGNIVKANARYQKKIPQLIDVPIDHEMLYLCELGLEQYQNKCQRLNVLKLSKTTL